MNNKRWLIVVFSVITIVLVTGSLVMVLPPKDYSYTKLVDGIEITSYKGDGGEVTIPSKIKGKPVTSIGRQAFRDCQHLRSVTIPQGVKSINDQAFYNCDRLESVMIPNSVVRIGNEAFSSCEGLPSIIIPNSVEEMGENPFFGSKGLQLITVEKGNNKFKSIEGVLYSVDMSTLFAYPIGKQDANFIIPDSVTTINKSAFSHCETLYSVIIPSNVKSIGLGAFSNCKNLKGIDIPEGVTSIENWTFEGCSSLASVEIPESVMNIGEAAFADSGLTSITIPNSVTNIEEKTFIGCEGLEVITIPESVRSIGDRALKNCSRLSDVFFSGTRAQWDTISKGIENDILNYANIHTRD